MNTQQILIEIRVNLQQQALQALTRSLGNLGNAAKTIQTGFGSMASGILGAIKQLTLWDSLFGRVTSAMIVWAGWRTIWRGFGFLADAIVGGNERMQTAIQTFTALSGGSREMADSYIGILQDLSIQTGASFDDLIANAKRLPTQVGQNLQAFTKLSKEAIVLGFLDPLQGIPGAFYAITNALEGDMEGFRSLIRRFEFSNRQDVKRILEETSNPMEALEKIFQTLGIDVDNLIESLKSTLPVIVMGLKNAFQIFFRTLGEPVITKITADLGKLRDSLMNNMPAVIGFGKAFGEGISGAYDKIKGFVGEIFLGDGAFDPGQFAQGAINLMAAFSEGLFSGFTNYVLPAITSIATFIAGFFIGASPPALGPLNQIREGGEETIKQYVLGMIKGLSASAIGEIAQNIIANIIDLEGMELAEEKAIDGMEKWVDEAAKMVQAARDRLQLFDIQTADIPERYTRGRRRQLELEAMAAEREERRRKEQLAIAREQLKYVQDYLKAQRQILQLLQQQQKAQEAAAKAEEVKKEFPKGFTPADIKNQDELIKQWQEKWAKAIEPVKSAWREGFRDIGDFIRGVLGKPPTGMEGFFGQAPPEMWLLGADFDKAFTKIGAAIKAAGATIEEVLDNIQGAFTSMPKEVQTVILALLGMVIAPKVALFIAAINILATNIKDLKTFQEFLLSVGAAVGAGWLIAGPAGALAVSIAILLSIVFREGMKEELQKWFGKEGHGKEIVYILSYKMAEKAGLPFDPEHPYRTAWFLPIPVQLMLNWDLVQADWEATGKPIFEAIGNWFADAFAKIGSDFSDVISFFTVDWAEIAGAFSSGWDSIKGDWQEIIDFFDGLVKKIATDWQDIREFLAHPFGVGLPAPEVDLTKQGDKAGSGLMVGIGAAISNASTDLATTVNDSIVKPVIGFFTGLYDEIVGKSIIPDMLRDIIRLFTQFPFQMRPPLTALTLLMTTTIMQIRMTWQTNLTAMVDATITAVDAMQSTLTRLQQTGTTKVYDPTTGTFIDVPVAPQLTNPLAAPTAANVGLGARASARTGSVPIVFNLNAAETRRFFEEGTYSAILNLTGAMA